MTPVGTAQPVVGPGPVPRPMAERVVATYQELERLVRESGPEPSGPINRVFAELVALCGHRPEADAAAVLADPAVGAVAGRLRELCAAGEFRLERCWARRIAAAGDAERELRAFPYLGNYRALTALEMQALRGLRADRGGGGGGGGLGRVCVLGSGPLPLTALLLARRLRAQVDAVDRDPEATALAGDVLGRLRGGGLVRPYGGEARDFGGVGEADLVVLAALVGADPAEKRSVLAAVAERMRPGALLLVRGAVRLRTLLYPPLSADDLATAGAGLLRPLAEVHPMTDVVNSFVVAARA